MSDEPKTISEKSKAAIAAYVEELMATRPPLSDEQKHQLRALLHPPAFERIYDYEAPGHPD